MRVSSHYFLQEASIGSTFLGDAFGLHLLDHEHAAQLATENRCIQCHPYIPGPGQTHARRPDILWLLLHQHVRSLNSSVTVNFHKLHRVSPSAECGQQRNHHVEVHDIECPSAQDYRQIKMGTS